MSLETRASSAEQESDSLKLALKLIIQENLCLEIQKPRSKPFVVATWYRPPDSPIGIFSPFETLIGKIDSENIEYFLMGDVNCDMIATRYDNNTRKLMSITDIKRK